MSRKKQAENYKILFTPLKYRMAMMFLDHRVHAYTWNVALVVRSGINDYVPLAGFASLAEAKAYRRKLIHAERRQGKN